MKVRPLTAQDWPQWRQLWTAYLEFYETELSEEVFETSFKRLLSCAPNQYCGLVAEQDGELIGLAHYLIHRELWSVEDTCYLSDLFVAPAIRKSGAGRALIEAVQSEAQKAGAETLYWQTERLNTTARSLYDELAELMPFVQYKVSL